jgi:hypothetical protein
MGWRFWRRSFEDVTGKSGESKTDLQGCSGEAKMRKSEGDFGMTVNLHPL